MRWDDLFDDLEAFAAAELQAEVEAEAADLARAERALLTLADRLRAHRGHEVCLHLLDGGRVSGPLRDVGPDWAALDIGRGSAVVPLPAVVGVDGLTRSAWAAPATGPDRPPAVQVRLGTVLRVLARDRSYVRLGLRDGGALGGTVDRVGADHLDLAVHPADEPRRPGAVSRVRCVPLAAVVVLRCDGDPTG